MAEGRGTDKIMGLSPRAWRRVDRAVRSGNVLLFLSALTLLVSVVGAFVMWLSNDDAFPTIGISLWWALQTVTTVGYGDIVPTGGLGRIIGGLLMALGVTYVAFMTAVVTSVLVSLGGERLNKEKAEERAEPPKHDGESHERRIADAIDRIEKRLTAIEKRLPG